MKRIIALFLVISFCLTIFVIPAVAVEPEYVEINHDYGFKIQKMSDSSEVAKRVYCSKNNFKTIKERIQLKTADNISNDSSHAETKAILSALGVDEELILNLDVNALERYSKAEEIIADVAYFKSNKDDGLTVVSEEEALLDVKKANETRAVVLPPLIDGNPIYEENFENSYMRITLITSRTGSESYHFSADAEWLIMPNYSSTDSFGICVNGHTIVRNSCYGEITYDKDPLIGTTSQLTVEYESSDFAVPINGSYTGAAIAFDVAYTNNVFFDYINYKVHIEFDTLVTYPNQNLNFNVIATYRHLQEAEVISSPTFSIDSSGNAGYSIGIETIELVTEYNVYNGEPYQYKPY